MAFKDAGITNAIEITYTRVAEWLKYAEAKNAVLVAFDSTVSLAIAGYLLDNMEPVFSHQWYIWLSLILFIGGAGISLISFLPQLNGFQAGQRQRHDDINPLYFADIATLHTSEYADLLKERYSINIEFSQYERDLIDQISCNSKIAFIKYRVFTIALWLNIMVLLTPLIILIPATTYLWRKHGRSKPGTK